MKKISLGKTCLTSGELNSLHDFMFKYLENASEKHGQRKIRRQREKIHSFKSQAFIIQEQYMLLIILMLRYKEVEFIRT